MLVPGRGLGVGGGAETFARKASRSRRKVGYAACALASSSATYILVAIGSALQDLDLVVRAFERTAGDPVVEEGENAVLVLEERLPELHQLADAAARRLGDALVEHPPAAARGKVPASTPLPSLILPELRAPKGK